MTGIAHTYDKPTNAKVREILTDICRALADAYVAGGHVLESEVNVLTEDAIEEFIPRLVFDIAVRAGWITFHPDPIEGLDWGMMLGHFELPDETKEIFLEFLSGALTPLREKALKDEEALQSKIDELNAKRNEWLQTLLNAPAKKTIPGRNAKALLAEYFDKSPDVFTFKDLAIKASPYRRKLDGVGVSASSITRISQGKFVEEATREAVAKALNEVLKLDPPCNRHDLLPPAKSDQANVKPIETA